jgi:hypothetical protein
MVDVKEYRLDEEYHNMDYSWTDKGKLVVQLSSVYRDADVSWDLGDGTVTSQKDFKHEYDQLGAYLIRLVVKADCGEFTFIEQIDLDELPKPESTNPSIRRIKKYIRKAKKRQRKAG